MTSNNNKKILIHSIAFSPDGVSTAYLYNDIASCFKDHGYHVVVLTTTPHYNSLESELKKQPLTRKLFGLYYISDFHGIKVIHVKQKKFKNSVARMIGFIYWHVMSLFLGMMEENVDVILSPSPPLTIGIINIMLGKFKRAKVIYNVQEIYPDFLINQGKLQSKFVINILKSMERFVYNKSNATVTIDKMFYNTIAPRFEDKTKLSVIPNFVDTDLYKPVAISDELLDPAYFRPKADILKIMYAGNIGHAQDWLPLIQISKALINVNVEFWIIGEGVMKSYLEEQVELHNLKNIHLVPYQNRELMPGLIAYADIQFIFMSPEMEEEGFPSKVYTIMACAKPLLVVSGENTPIYNFLKPLNCAYLINDRLLNTQTEKLVEIINGLVLDKSVLRVLGENGFNHIQDKYSKNKITSQYLTLCDKLTATKFH
jgi:colanic acid biosynthesis glycosyl transferase WcaI